jgi:hypothetical protein
MNRRTMLSALLSLPFVNWFMEPNGGTRSVYVESFSTQRGAWVVRWAFAARKDADDFVAGLRLQGLQGKYPAQSFAELHDKYEWVLFSMWKPRFGRCENSPTFMDMKAGFDYIDNLRIRQA